MRDTIAQFTASSSRRSAAPALAQLSGVNTPATGGITVAGAALEDQVLTAINTLADDNGLGAMNYQWQSSADGTLWNNIDGATAGSLSLGDAQVGRQVRVTASFLDGRGTTEAASSIAGATVANINDVPGGAVTMSGLPAQGQTLTVANTLSDGDGLGNITYQWKASGAAIAGATTGGLVLTQALVGKAISVTASYTDAHGTGESVASVPTSAVATINDAPIAGHFGNRSAGPGQQLSLDPGKIFSDADGELLTFGISGLPAGLSMNTATGQIAGVAPAAAGVHHITMTGIDSSSVSASVSFDLSIVIGNNLTTSVFSRAGIALPGVTLHELASTTPPGSLFALKNIAMETNSSTGIDTVTAEVFATGSGNEHQAGFTLSGAGGASLQSFQLTGAVTAANGWAISESHPAGGYTFAATNANSSIAAGALIGKLTLMQPSTVTQSDILNLVSASLENKGSPDRSLSYAQADIGAGGQLSAALPDSDLALSFSRGTADYLVNGTTKPVTAADALDALKLSVGLAASRGSSWKELISADMNHDGRVTAADALEILKVSVGVNTVQPYWVFVPDDAGSNANLGTMTRATVTYKDDFSLSSISGPTSATITGILVGDVNNSWVIPA